jgi:hypothetical protein
MPDYSGCTLVRNGPDGNVRYRVDLDGLHFEMSDLQLLSLWQQITRAMLGGVICAPPIDVAVGVALEQLRHWWDELQEMKCNDSTLSQHWIDLWVSEGNGRTPAIARRLLSTPRP